MSELEPERRYKMSGLIEIAQRRVDQLTTAGEAGTTNPDVPQQLTDWPETLAVLQIMKRRGFPESLKDD